MKHDRLALSTSIQLTTPALHLCLEHVAQLCASLPVAFQSVSSNKVTSSPKTIVSVKKGDIYFCHLDQ